jgi:hypothetical protein
MPFIFMLLGLQSRVNRNQNTLHYPHEQDKIIDDIKAAGQSGGKVPLGKWSTSKCSPSLSLMLSSAHNFDLNNAKASEADFGIGEAV